MHVLNLDAGRAEIQQFLIRNLLKKLQKSEGPYIRTLKL